MTMNSIVSSDGVLSFPDIDGGLYGVASRVLCIGIVDGHPVTFRTFDLPRPLAAAATAAGLKPGETFIINKRNDRYRLTENGTFAEMIR